MYPYIWYKSCNCILVAVFMINSPVMFHFSSQTKVDNACLVGVGYTQTLRPGQLIACLKKKTVSCNNNAKRVCMVTWFTIWRSSLQAWSSPSQVWSTGRTWTAADTRSAWVSSWRRKGLSGRTDKERGEQHRRRIKSPNVKTPQRSTQRHVNTPSLWVLHTYAHILWP